MGMKKFAKKFGLWQNSSDNQGLSNWYDIYNAILKFFRKIINDIFFWRHYGYESIRNSQDLFKKNFSRAIKK